MRRILILGATSAIAESAARDFARHGDALVLAGRNADRLQAIAADLKLRGAALALAMEFDARNTGICSTVVEDAAIKLGGLDAALIAFGTLSDQVQCQTDADLMLEEIQVNALSVMVLCTHLANRFEAQGNGTIAVISSVAGDRGRQSNYVYGSAKAAVTAFTSGLRQRLCSKGVRVVTIKPGFVDSPMTAAFKKGPLWASSASVGKTVALAMIRGTPVVYTPWFWRPIMSIVIAIPEFVFRRLKL